MSPEVLLSITIRFSHYTLESPNDGYLTFTACLTKKFTFYLCCDNRAIKKKLTDNALPTSNSEVIEDVVINWCLFVYIGLRQDKLPLI